MLTFPFEFVFPLNYPTYYRYSGLRLSEFIILIWNSYSWFLHKFLDMTNIPFDNTFIHRLLFFLRPSCAIMALIHIWKNYFYLDPYFSFACQFGHFRNPSGMKASLLFVRFSFLLILVLLKEKNQKISFVDIILLWLSLKLVYTKR